MAWYLFPLLTGIFTAGLMVSDYWKNALGRYITKPLAALCFVGTAWQQGCLQSSYGMAVFVALWLCLGGDVLLMPKSKTAFRFGIISFGLGHLGFLVAFFIRGLAWKAALMASVVVLPLSFLIGRYLVPKVSADFQPIVKGYMGVLSVMLIAAWSTHGSTSNWLLAIGATGFYFSDLAVALERFVKSSFRNKAWGTPLYFGAQVLLALSVGNLALR